MIKSAIYLIGICLMLTGCEQRSLPSQQIRLANQGLLSADLASSGKLALVSSLGQGTVVWDLEQGKERWRWRQSDDQEEFVTLTRFSPMTAMPSPPPNTPSPSGACRMAAPRATTPCQNPPARCGDLGGWPPGAHRP